MDMLSDLIKCMVGMPVTQRIKQVKQPHGGYIMPKQLTVVSLGDGADALNPVENVHAILVGLTVDYMTRFITGASVQDAFSISLRGAKIAGEMNLAHELVSNIKGLDDNSIICAMKLSGFDVCFRSGIRGYKPVQGINPDADTIANIRVMIQRALHFFDEYGPKMLDGFTFEGGYTDIVTSGDGDFTTSDTLWDFKVSKSPVKKEHTLQLLMYWRMGLHSVHSEFLAVKYLGIFNPRLNTVSRIAVADIPQEVIDTVESKVIGY